MLLQTVIYNIRPYKFYTIVNLLVEGYVLSNLPLKSCTEFADGTSSLGSSFHDLIARM